ncbi:hypothetical protein [Ralstonia sp. A12]|uniref:hypothetical protein n=1 Tax=Ralstonia sp. A12 TaxID=1217052 RepID=UPI0012ED6839|nr:hypothetical protein [Ralstonia sp. A12]
MSNKHPRLATIKGFMLAADELIASVAVNQLIRRHAQLSAFWLPYGLSDLVGAAGARRHLQAIDGQQYRALRSTGAHEKSLLLREPDQPVPNSKASLMCDKATLPGCYPA